MPTFLTRQQLYRLLQRELPEDVYPDGAPSAFYSTADMDSIADVAATGYANLERIYANYFPQSADEYIDKWIAKLFIGTSFDAGVTLQDKRDRVIAKIRKQPTLALWEILILVAGYLPEGKYVQVVEWCCASGTWMLGESALGVETSLGFNTQFNELGVSAAVWCSFVSNRGWELGIDQLGIGTELDQYGQEVMDVQLGAFGYEVRIFGYEVTGTSYAQMVRQIKETEPARSVHLVRQNLDLNDYGLTNAVTGVDQFSSVNCITRDSASDTGYSGLTI